MSFPEEVKRRHERLSPWFRRFLEYVEHHPEHQRWLDLYENMPQFLQGFYPMQCWPTLVSGAVLEEIARVGVGVCGLIKTIPERIFDRDPARIADYYGLDPHVLTREMLEEPTALRGAFSRGDFIEAADGLKCLEVNHSSGIGGWQLRFWADAYLKLPYIVESMGEALGRVSYRDPFQALVEHVADEALSVPGCAGPELNLVLLASSDAAEIQLEGIAILQEEYRRCLERRGMDGRLLCCYLAELRAQGERVFVGDTRAHAVVGYDMMESASSIFRSFKEGNVLLYNGPLTRILRDKRNLALLSEHAESDLFDARERALIQEHIAWTRRVAADFVSYRGERVFLPDLLLDHREDLVLKKGFSLQGKDVIIGAATSPEEWERVAASAEAHGDWVVQEWVDSVQYLYQAGESGSALHDVVWALFAFGERFGGAVMRMVPAGERAVINAARGATLGILLEVAEP